MKFWQSKKRSKTMEIPMIKSVSGPEPQSQENDAADTTLPQQATTTSSVSGEVLLRAGGNPVESLEACALEGYIEGLKGVEINPGVLPADFRKKALEKDYQIPDKAWGIINQLSCEQQAWVIYVMIRSAHIWSALQLASSSKGAPLKGKEHLGLPLELAGEANLVQMLTKIEPLLPRLGLDKGITRGEGNGVNYPSVLTLFYKNRAQFFRVNNLERITDLCRFVMNLRDRMPNWPERLARIYRDPEAALNACDLIEANYVCSSLHSRSRRG